MVLPDLVQDSRLDVEIHDGCAVQIYFEADAESQDRPKPKMEVWSQVKQIGGGGFGSVWLEKCTSGRQEGATRAVKRLAIKQTGLRDASYVRELETIAKFSQERVGITKCCVVVLFVTDYNSIDDVLSNRLVGTKAEET
jgi:hypothetical protein